VKGLWKGTAPLVYRNYMAMFFKVTFYDKMKNYFMPYKSRKYKGMDYFFRTACASICAMSISTLFVYPFDVYHTRMSTDMTPSTKAPLYKSTFDCFSMTNVEEGRYGAFKGIYIAVPHAILKSLFTMPVYEQVRRNFGQGKEQTYMNQFMQRVGCSLLSGLLISLVLYPIDTGKRIC
jgi:hypothetical protein